MSFLAKNIRFLRKQRGQKQGDVSKLFNKKANTVGNWENRKSEPSVGEIVRLAEHFGVGLHDLLNADLTQGGSLRLQTDRNKETKDEPSKSYPINEPYLSLAMDEHPDSFWVLIRELRSINEKLDQVKLTLESGQARPGLDKSNH